MALALLCGSDYSDGVFGVGKEAALKLFGNVSDCDIIEHLKSWKTKVAHYERLSRQINDKNVCSACGHSGKVQSHTKLGKLFVCLIIIPVLG